MQTKLWQQIEIDLHLSQRFEEPYLEFEGSVDFVHASGKVLNRPIFWDGDRGLKVRFAPDLPGFWTYEYGVHSGTVEAIEASDGEPNRFLKHGFWRMSPAGRTLVHADGRPAILAADTPWALPWRATPEQVWEYAGRRQSQGFNAALLMTMQPDMDARGPRDRTADEGFDVAFEDLQDGHINRINSSYFQYLDELIEILREHEIVPVFQPVFHGYGWKGLRTAGAVIPVVEMERYARYLVARYGAGPAIWLAGADGLGTEPNIEAAGKAFHELDCYEQPTGVHYRPHARANAHQGESWLDFQWCQTGHGGDHAPQRVAEMWLEQPPKAVANGEPTYENAGHGSLGAGWWQGAEAWVNYCAGGTMGIVYGAASLWQWRLHRDEPGHSTLFVNPEAGWREALEAPGAAFVGLLPKILEGFDTTDLEPSCEHVIAPHALYGEGRIYICYAEHGGWLQIMDDKIGLHYRIVDPRTGEALERGVREPGAYLHQPIGEPRVYILTYDDSASR